MPSSLNLRARLAEALAPHAVAALRSDLATVTADCDRLRCELTRYRLHLDDIRCDLADAGIPVPEGFDPELTPRRMVGAALDRLALATMAGQRRPVVPEARIVAIVRAAEGGERHTGGSLTAMEIAHVVTGLSLLAVPFNGMTEASIVRVVSDVAALGYVASNGRKPARYSVTAAGRALLDEALDARAVAS